MKTVAQLCKPRENVFVDTTRDDVLNLSDLVEGRIDATKFFDENFKTRGIWILRLMKMDSLRMFLAWKPLCFLDRIIVMIRVAFIRSKKRIIPRQSM